MGPRQGDRDPVGLRGGWHWIDGETMRAHLRHDVPRDAACVRRLAERPAALLGTFPPGRRASERPSDPACLRLACLMIVNDSNSCATTVLTETGYRRDGPALGHWVKRYLSCSRQGRQTSRRAPGSYTSWW